MWFWIDLSRPPVDGETCLTFVAVLGPAFPLLGARCDLFGVVYGIGVVGRLLLLDND